MNREGAAFAHLAIDTDWIAVGLSNMLYNRLT